MQNLKRYAAILACSTMFLPVVSSAQSMADLQAQISTLLAEITALKSQLGQQNNNSGRACVALNRDFGIGEAGSHVGALQNLLAREGLDLSNTTENEFDEDLAAAVVQFQAKHGIRQTGYVGPRTRAKLNQLYRCLISEGRPLPTPTPISASTTVVNQVQPVSNGQSLHWAGYTWHPILLTYGTESSYGNWHVENDTLQQDHGGALHYKIVARGMGSQDNYEVQAQLWFEHGSELGLCGRMDEHGNGYCFSTGWDKSTNYTFISRLVNNDQNPDIILGNQKPFIVTPGVSHNMKIRFEGSQISGKVWRAVDPEPSEWNATLSDTTFARGKIAFYTYGSSPVITSVTVTPIATSGNNVTITTTTTMPVVTTNAPVMVFPQEGQTLMRNQLYTFSVQGINGATGYLFGFKQDLDGNGQYEDLKGEMIHENFRDTGQLAPYPSYTYQLDSSKFRSGNLQIWVRAWLGNQWTEARVTNVTI